MFKMLHRMRVICERTLRGIAGDKTRSKLKPLLTMEQDYHFYEGKNDIFRCSRVPTVYFINENGRQLQFCIICQMVVGINRASRDCEDGYNALFKAADTKIDYNHTLVSYK